MSTLGRGQEDLNWEPQGMYTSYHCCYFSDLAHANAYGLHTGILCIMHFGKTASGALPVNESHDD